MIIAKAYILDLTGKVVNTVLPINSFQLLTNFLFLLLLNY